MNVKDKLEGFSKIAIREAETKRVKILNEINLEYKNACDETTLKAQKKAESLINEEQYKAEQMKNREILNAMTQAKKSLIDLRKQLKDDLFKNVMAKLADYIETDNYADSLINDIKNLAIKYNGKITVYLCRRDMVFAERLLEIPNVKIVEDKDDLIGGYRAILNEENIVIDNSYKEKLKEANDAFIGFKIT